MRTETLANGTLDHMTPEEIEEALEDHEIVLIDVRTPQEFAFEHIRGALLSPLATFDPKNLPTQTDKRIVLHCGSGVRSRKVAEMCLAAGLERIAHLEGGFGAWKQAGLAYIGVNPATGALMTKS